MDDWARIILSGHPGWWALPVGPVDYPTPMVYLAGGVPRVMLHLRRLEAAARRRAEHRHRETLDARPRAGGSVDAVSCCGRLHDVDGVDPDDVILSPQAAEGQGMASTVTFPPGNIAPRVR